MVVIVGADDGGVTVPEDMGGVGDGTVGAETGIITTGAVGCAMTGVAGIMTTIPDAASI